VRVPSLVEVKEEEDPGLVKVREEGKKNGQKAGQSGERGRCGLHVEEHGLSFENSGVHGSEHLGELLELS
jgi:hypothetical protein